MANKLITSAMLDAKKLSHYGVLGMKWGVRKQNDSSQKKYTRGFAEPITTKKLEKYTSVDEYYKAHLGDTYTNFPKSYKHVLSDYWEVDNRYYWDTTKKSYAPKQDKQMLDFFDRLDSFITNNRGVSSFDELNKIPQDANSMALQADWTKINDLDEIPDIEKKMEHLYNNIDDYTVEEAQKLFAQYALYKLNCTNCVSAYELRRRGYDVEAMPYENEITLNRIEDISKDYKNGLDWVDIPVKDNSKTESLVKETILKISNVSQRGYVVVDSHIFNYEVEKGNVHWIDGQSPKVNDASILSNFKETKEVQIARTDNKTLNDSILARVRNRDKE